MSASIVTVITVEVLIALPGSIKLNGFFDVILAALRGRCNVVSVMSEYLQFLDFTSFLSVFLSMLSKILALFTFATLVAAEFPRGSFFIRNVKTGNVVTVRGGSIEVC